MSGQPGENRKHDRSRLVAMVITGLGLLVLSVVSLVFLSSPQAETASIDTPLVAVMPGQVSFTAPELELTDLNGNPVALSKTAGQVVLVNNWAFWCPPCRAEIPEIQAYYDAHRQQGFTVIGIEAGGEKVDVAYHVKLFQVTYPIWLDPEQSALRAFQNFSLPNSYVIDKKGTVRLAWTGVIDRIMLEKYVTPLLEE